MCWRFILPHPLLHLSLPALHQSLPPPLSDPSLSPLLHPSPLLTSVCTMQHLLYRILRTKLKMSTFSSALILFPVSPTSNLLRPSGVCLTPSTLTVRVIRGEDLPQMDAGYFEGVKKLLNISTVQKERVDPYCTVFFAGHKGKTKVIWNKQDPEWNAQINLGIRVCGCGYCCHVPN